MNCKAFESRWQAILDGEAPPDPFVSDLAAHARQCDGCGTLHAGYVALAQSLPALSYLIPSAPEGMPNRIVELWKLVARVEIVASQDGEAIVSTKPLARRFRWVQYAAAACIAFTVVAAGLWSWRFGESESITAANQEMQITVDPAVPPLEVLIARTTAATLELARTTAAPAARLGRLVFVSTVDGQHDPASSHPETGTDTVIPGLDAIGGGFQERVKPITQPARSAFEFLLGPATTKPATNAPRERDA